MANIPQLLTEHMDIWTVAETEKKSGRGRGRTSSGGNGGSVYGVKKLRELILELAVRGKLVPQDPNDEPASELLKRIQAEKAKSPRTTSKRKSAASTIPPFDKGGPGGIGEDEKPFELPQGWEWVRLGLIGHIGSSSRIHQKDWTNSGVPFYRAREIVKLAQNGFVDNELFINEELFETLKQNAIIPEPNDIMITGVGTIGVPYVVKPHDKFYFKDASVLIFKNFSNLYTGHLNHFLLSTIWNEKIHSESMGTTVHTLTIERAKDVLIPLPPLAEQHRIVAKVDELMALCDQLEQQHTNAQEAHETLVSQLLATLTQSQNAAEFNANWQRIDAHFDLLFTTEASIDALKQTLLQLAVMGKLVPQDPTDEPASELLKRIQAEKAKSPRTTSKRKSAASTIPPFDKGGPGGIGEDEKPFELPQGWEWVRLGSLGDWGAGATPLRSVSSYYGGAMPWFKSGELIADFIDTAEEKVTELALKECSLRLNQPGDVLIAMYGATIGKASILKIAATTNQAVCACTPNGSIFNKYLLLMLKAMKSNFVGQGAGGAQPNISREKIIATLTALPPFAEQHRIVAKVDELMALCDQLKTRIQQAGQQQQAIADALVVQAVS